MKKHIRLLSFICVLAMLASVSAVTAFAVPAPLCVGDVEWSDFSYIGSNINVKDATLVQKFVAELEDLNKAQQYCAEVDFDGKITVKDATMIQKKVAGVIKRFPFPEDFRDSWDYVRSNCFYANFDSGKAMVGEPVTFSAVAYGGEAPFSFEYRINGEVVRERAEEPSFTYTFEEAGTYNIEVVMYNCFDTSCSEKMKYTVVEPYTSDTVILKALYYDNNTRREMNYGTTVTAEAFMGSGEYEYRFIYDGVLLQDFSSNNQVFINTDYPAEEGIYTLTASVRDINSPNTVVSENLEIYVSHAIG